MFERTKCDLALSHLGSYKYSGFFLWQELCAGPVPPSSVGSHLDRMLNSMRTRAILNLSLGNSLVVQWLGLSSFTAEDPGSIPGQGTKIPQAMWCGKKPNQNKTKKTLVLKKLTWLMVKIMFMFSIQNHTSIWIMIWRWKRSKNELLFLWSITMDWVLGTGLNTV